MTSMVPETRDSRIRSLRLELGWSQAQMANYLRLTQAAVSLMEIRQPESGPVSKLLDQLEAQLARGEEPEVPAADENEARAS